jgi:lon-related putative ATP-dependent protease
MTTPPTELAPEQLYRRVDPAQMPFSSTADAEEFSAIIGQARAVDAVQFGVGIRHAGYNLFVMGQPGVGKNTYVRRVLEQQATAETTPDDYCYVHNFLEPHKPCALRMPAGSAHLLRDSMRQLMDELHHYVPAAFETDQYRSQVLAIEQELKQREESQFLQLQRDAEEKQVSLFRTPTGYTFAPTHDGKVLDAEEFEKLPEDERKRAEANLSVLQERLEEFIRGLSRMRRERRTRVKRLNREVSTAAVSQLIAEVKKDFAPLANVMSYLDAVQQDAIDNADAFRHPDEPSSPLAGVMDHGMFMRRYDVNVLVDHGATHGAPIVYETLPTHQNLVGRIEHISQLGALVTDFMLIKPGALHAANGGYLVLDARKVLSQPYAWEGLKHVLQSRTIRIESLGQVLGYISTVSLEPEPIPLDVKVVLVGERILYYLLAELDHEFGELFKVVADFEDTMPGSAENNLLYARLLGSLCRKEKLKAFDRGAIARLIEHSARLAGDADKLSMHFGKIVDVMREADYYAQKSARAMVLADDVSQAIATKVHRLSRVHEIIVDEISNNVILIDTHGENIAQVNALSVIEVGDFAYAQPSRVTATVRMGEGDIVNIEREIELSGAIHSKGVLILSAFLASRYAIEHPLSLSASLVFEQSYGMVDGDSASMAELAALLSALAGLPIKQSLAITGAVNQHGQIQAIGAVNEKIEGYFDVCLLRGLTGEQGVLIPAANTRHLMLRHDVVAAVAAGQFHIYPLTTTDEAMELLTGVPAGMRDADGTFPKDSVNQRVEERLTHYAEARHSYEEKSKE